MKKRNEKLICCKHFNWYLRIRSGVFYADGRCNKPSQGKHSLGTRDKNEAHERLRQLDRKKAMELGLVSNVIEPDSTISIVVGWHNCLESCARTNVLGGVSKSTLKRYQAVRDKHIRYCAKRAIDDWNRFDVAALEAYGNWLSTRWADRTLYLELTLVKSVVGWLIKNRNLPPACKLDYPLRKPQGSATYCYDRRQVMAMIEHCKQRLDLVWLGAVISALAHTGLRISELAGLRWSDVNLEQQTIRIADERSSRRLRPAESIRTTKGRRSRIIPIHPALTELLLSMKRNADGFVFHAIRGGRLRPRNVLAAFIAEVIEPLKNTFPTPAGETGFEHGRLHGFRHFFCSQAFLGGASEGEIKEWLGHADSKMVENYRHLRAEEAHRQMAKIDFLGRSDGRPNGP